MGGCRGLLLLAGVAIISGWIDYFRNGIGEETNCLSNSLLLSVGVCMQQTPSSLPGGGDGQPSTNVKW